MKGKNTAIIMGAGASACYEDGVFRIPTQASILRSLICPKLSTSSGYGAPTFVNTQGITHSFPLAQYIHKRFNILQKDGGEATTFWEELVETKQVSLESFYESLEEDKSEDGPYACQDFKAIIRTKIADTTGDRSIEKTCRHHRKLIKRLEPGDYIINFNWDTVVDDILLYESPYWFPLTGYGVPIAGMQGDFANKHFPVKSLIELYHIHGSVGLYEPLDHVSRNEFKIAFVVGPKGHSTANVLSDLMGITQEDISKATKEGKQPTPKRNPTEEETALAEQGCIWISAKKMWLQPIFIPPSKTKPEYRNWYSSLLRKKIISKLPYTEQFIIAGYSFPPADLDHLHHFFVSEIISEDAKFKCVNLENNDEGFKNRVKMLFPKWEIDFSTSDFKQLCNSL